MYLLKEVERQCLGVETPARISALCSWRHARHGLRRANGYRCCVWGAVTASVAARLLVANSFTINSSNASSSGAPASFPSVYIGANGDIANGTFSTWSDSGLPKQNSAISSIQTSFTWSGGTSGGVVR